MAVNMCTCVVDSTNLLTEMCFPVACIYNLYRAEYSVCMFVLMLVQQLKSSSAENVLT